MQLFAMKGYRLNILLWWVWGKPVYSVVQCFSAPEFLCQVLQWGRVPTFINLKFRQPMMTCSKHSNRCWDRIVPWVKTSQGPRSFPLLPWKNHSMIREKLKLCRIHNKGTILPSGVKANFPDHQLFILTTTWQEVSPWWKCHTVDWPLQKKNVFVIEVVLKWTKILSWAEVCLPGGLRGCRECRSGEGHRSSPEILILKPPLYNFDEEWWIGRVLSVSWQGGRISTLTLLSPAPLARKLPEGWNERLVAAPSWAV